MYGKLAAFPRNKETLSGEVNMTLQDQKINHYCRL